MLEQIELIVQPFLLAFFGTTASQLIFRKGRKRELIAFPILITLLSLLFSNYLETFDETTLWGICGLAGFFIPSLKKWLKAKTLLRVIVKGANNAKSATEGILEEIEKEIDKDDEKDI